MATYTGSGKWFKVSSGRLSFGMKSGGTETTYGSAYAYSIASGGVTYKGMYVGSMSYINLSGLSELSIGDAKGYTGTVKMYTYFYDPYNVLIWDPQEFKASNVKASHKTYRFVHGIMVGEA